MGRAIFKNGLTEKLEDAWIVESDLMVNSRYYRRRQIGDEATISKKTQQANTEIKEENQQNLTNHYEKWYVNWTE